MIRGNGKHGVENWDPFVMSGGVIAGNSELGVYSDGGNTTFDKTGGVIYGSAEATGLKNNSGAVNDARKESRDTTLWETDGWHSP